jgi:hypothetical protein
MLKSRQQSYYNKRNIIHNRFLFSMIYAYNWEWCGTKIGGFSHSLVLHLWVDFYKSRQGNRLFRQDILNSNHSKAQIVFMVHVTSDWVARGNGYPKQFIGAICLIQPWRLVGLMWHHIIIITNNGIFRINGRL